MPNQWNNLSRQIAILRNVEPTWPEHFSESIKVKLIFHHAVMLNKLQRILANPIADEFKQKELRRFLTMYDALLRPNPTALSIPSIDYTFNFSLPFTEAMQLVALEIKQPTESVCEILMPSVSRIIGSSATAETDIQGASEDADGKFILSHYLRASSGELIAISDIFERAPYNLDEFFSNPQLSAEDHHNLRRCAGKASEEYYDMLKKSYRIRQNQKPSVGNALLELKNALLQSSEIDSGIDAEADLTKCKAPIYYFYKIWRALPDTERNKIKKYTVQHGTDSLESFLICLFTRASNTPMSELGASNYVPEMPLSADENLNSQWGRIFHCLHQIGRQLENLVGYHQDLMDIPEPGKEAEFEKEALPTAEQQDALLVAVKTAIASRPALIGDDEICLSRMPFFKHICADFTMEITNPVELFLANPAYTRCVQTSLSGIATIVSLLPKQYWPDFFKYYYEVDGQCAFRLLVPCFQLLPPTDWIALLTSLSQHCPRNRLLINELCVDQLLSEIPLTKWPMVVEVMRKMKGVIFRDRRDFEFVLQNRPVENWMQLVRLFQPELEKLCATDAYLIPTLFKSVSPAYRDALCHALTPVLKNYSKKGVLIRQVLLGINIEYRMRFLGLLVKCCGEIKVDAEDLSALLKNMLQSDWKAIFELLYAKSSIIFLKNDCDISVFLNQFIDSRARAICATAMQPFVPVAITSLARTAFLVLTKCQECEYPISLMLRHAMPPILRDLIVTIKQSQQHLIDVPAEIKKSFYLLTKVMLPVLLSYQNIFAYFPEHVSINSLSRNANQLLSKFQKLEDSTQRGETQMARACQLKLIGLIDFFATTVPSDPIESVFCEKIAKVYGSTQFFDDLFACQVYLQQCDHLHAKCDMGTQADSGASTFPQRLSVTPTVVHIVRGAANQADEHNRRASESATRYRVFPLPPPPTVSINPVEPLVHSDAHQNAAQRVYEGLSRPATTPPLDPPGFFSANLRRVDFREVIHAARGQPETYPTGPRQTH